MLRPRLLTKVCARVSGVTTAEPPSRQMVPLLHFGREPYMGFELKNVLSAIGPSASIVFAAWIFMSFLQSRYTTAFQLYRELIQQCRDGRTHGIRGTNIRDQVMLFKRRFELMKYAVNLGLAAAILLISTLIGGALDVVFPGLSLIKVLSTCCAISGFILVIVAAFLVIKENSIIQRAVNAELLDVPELAERAGEQAGRITDPSRGRPG
jgi:hypothetical protein